MMISLQHYLTRIEVKFIINHLTANLETMFMLEFKLTTKENMSHQKYLSIFYWEIKVMYQVKVLAEFYNQLKMITSSYFFRIMGHLDLLVFQLNIFMQIHS
jgi:hypothetical protein